MKSNLYHIVMALFFLVISGCRDHTLIASGRSISDSDNDTDTAVDSIGPQLRVDLNISGRAEAEVNEPDYASWPIESDTMLSHDFDGVGVSLELAGTTGTSLTSEWYKAGVQSPTLARLVNDGVTVSDGDGGAEIRMTVSGLPAGPHTLLTFHNTFINSEGATFGPIDIYVNGVLAADNVAPSNRVANNADAASAYLHFDAIEGEDVVFLFQADPESTADIRNVVICGFELNTSDIQKRAVIPAPRNGDEHVDGDDGTTLLSWRAAAGAQQHHLYLGVDKTAVSEATPDSVEYQGAWSAASFTATDLYSMNTYFWRVDEEDADGNVTPGIVWSFRPRQLAFPEAEGYGRFARGGRQGDVIYVTNLNDSGAGSLREALTEHDSARTVLFSVSGVIPLASALVVTDSKITIAGESAPGKGICLSGAPFALSGAQDVIIRNIRVRAGASDTQDAMGVSGDHVIMDSCSVSWSTNVALTSRSAQHVTVQRCLISEALNAAGHEDYPAGTEHGFATSLGGDIGSFHHNLLAHNQSRNFSLDGGLDGNGVFAGKIDIFNNVVYNWRNGLGDGGAHQVNYVNNHFQPGPASTWFTALSVQYESFPGTQQYYVAGNLMPGYFDETTQETAYAYIGTPDGYEPWVTEPFFPSEATVQSATLAYKTVLSSVGASQPLLDDHDYRVIQETVTGTTTYVGSVTGYPGIPDHESDVGGLEDYGTDARDATWDSDLDGIPDFWENWLGTDPNSESGDFSDSHNDDDRDGWTRLDEYLQWLANPHYFADESTPVILDVSALFVGFTDTPVYSIDNVTGGTADLNGTQITFTPGSCGPTSLIVTVTDATGASMTRTVGVFSCL